MEKLTNVKALNYVIDNYELPEEILNKLVKIREAQENKSTKKVNEDLLQRMELIITGVENEGSTATEIQSRVPELAGQPNQKISAALNKLVKEGRIFKRSYKGRTLFSTVDHSGEKE